MLAASLTIADAASATTAVPSTSSVREWIEGAAVAATARTARAVGERTRADTAQVRLGHGNAAIGAFVAYPTGDPVAPGVIVIAESGGAGRPIHDVARRLAREGYVAVVPDLPEVAHVDGAPWTAAEEARALAGLRAAGRWLSTQTASAGRPFGVVGFTRGGTLAQALALDTAGVAAAVSFYGEPITEEARLLELRAPLQAHFAAADAAVPILRVGAFKGALGKLGKPAEIHVYPGAGSGFMNETAASYHADAARQAWARTLAFLQKHLK